jgi:hypothetical protein
LLISAIKSAAKKLRIDNRDLRRYQNQNMEPTQIKIVVFCVMACASFYLINLTPNSKRSFTEELTVYQEDLPPAENLLLATGYRTGSSFISELFNQNDDVFYVIYSFKRKLKIF